MKYKLSFLFSFFLAIGIAQDNVISGKLVDNFKESIPFANIIVHSDSLTLDNFAYGFSDIDGLFSIELPSTKKTLYLSITAIGYAEKKFTLTIEKNKELEIQMIQEITELKEVVISAPKNKDTLNLDIQNLNLAKDDNLKEILDKAGGVIISENGGISYQGKQIKKININGKEVFVNQNTLALDKLTFEIMENVQIIDNHKDKFSLDFNKVRSPIININTKSEFKGIFKSELDVGYGQKERYNAGGKAFFFSDKFNVFLTSNTNNFGDQELSLENVTASIQKYKTNVLENAISPFFETDLRVRNFFSSNNSLTLRKEGASSKSGVVLYYGNIKTERGRSINTFLSDTIIRTRDFDESRSGNFWSTAINHLQKLSSKTVFQNITSTIITSSSGSTNTNDSIINITPLNFSELLRIDPKSFTFSNSAKITTLLKDKIAFDVGLDFFYTDVSNPLNTELLNLNTSSIQQQLDYSNLIFDFNSRFQFKLNRSIFNIGASINSRTETATTEFINDSLLNDEVERNLIVSSIPLSYEGSINRFDYKLSLSPTLISSQQSGSDGFLSLSNTFVYNFKAQKKLSIGISRNYQFQDISKLLNTVNTSFNNLTISDIQNIDDFSIKNQLSLSWFNNNVVKSKNEYFVYDFSIEDNFIQPILFSVSDNLFTYVNEEFNNRQTHSLNFGAKKSFYLGKKLNRFSLAGDFDFNYSTYPTIISEEEIEANISSWQPKITLSYLPRNIFIREIKNSIYWNPSIFNLDNRQINRQTTTNNKLTIDGGRNKTNWSIDFNYTFFDLDQLSFNVPDINLIFDYEINKSLNLSLKGENILTLFNLNNFNSVNTFSDGNLVTQVFNDNTISYLILKAGIKF